MKRMPSLDRREQLLAIALEEAAKVGVENLVRGQIADRAECSLGLLTNYFGTMTEFKRTIMREAIKRKDVAVVARGLAADNRYARKADPALRAQATAFLTEKAAA